MSHVAFLADGRFLRGHVGRYAAGFVRLQLRAGSAPRILQAGVVEQSRSGHVVQLVLQDLIATPSMLWDIERGIADVHELAMSLEEIYTAVLSRYHHGSANGVSRPTVFAAESSAEFAAVAERPAPAEEGGRS